MHSRIILKCHRSRTTRAIKRKFEEEKLQQPGTSIQKAHSASSTKNKSRSASQIRTTIDNNEHILDKSRQRNKVQTSRPLSSSECCNFSIQIVCTKNDNKWYLRHNKETDNYHSGHLPIANSHLQMSILNIDKEVLEYVDELLSQKVDAKKI